MEFAAFQFSDSLLSSSSFRATPEWWLYASVVFTNLRAVGALLSRASVDCPVGIHVCPWCRPQEKTEDALAVLVSLGAARTLELRRPPRCLASQAELRADVFFCLLLVCWLFTALSRLIHIYIYYMVPPPQNLL